MLTSANAKIKTKRELPMASLFIVVFSILAGFAEEFSWLVIVLLGILNTLNYFYLRRGQMVFLWQEKGGVSFVLVFVPMQIFFNSLLPAVGFSARLGRKSNCLVLSVEIPQ